MRRQAGWQSLRTALEEEVTRDTFKAEWLAQSEVAFADFNNRAASMLAEEREALAIVNGFRTARSQGACYKHGHEISRLYVHDPVMQELWQRLRELDAKAGWGPSLYGPHNGGVPAKLIHAVVTWYQAPKLTKADRTKHNKKIAALCDQLLDLLGQVTPGGVADHLGTLTLTPTKAENLFNIFAAPKRRRQQFGDGPEFAASHLASVLSSAGFTPMWAIQGLAESARLPVFFTLPPKVAAKTAFRTYFIRELHDSLGWSVIALKKPRRPMIPDDLFAQVVSRVVDVDCTIDDVRKAVKQYELEKSRLHKAEMVHSESNP